MGHRAYVGGFWDEIGKLQFEFLIREGLQPHHHVWDIACGSLRGGVHLIPYLDPGHYLGVEKEADLVKAGLEQELEKELEEEKAPQFLVTERFDFSQAETRPHYAIAQSLFTHLPPPLIETCLVNLRPFMRPDGQFFATFHEVETEIRNPKRPHDHGYFGYTRAQMEAFGTRHGWLAEYIGDWNHPRGQVMVCYRPKTEVGP